MAHRVILKRLRKKLNRLKVRSPKRYRRLEAKLKRLAQ